MTIRSAPWAVAIIDRLSPSNSILCSGSIIDSSHVLTAAHCLYDSAGRLRPAGSLVIKAGVSNYLKAKPGHDEQDRYVGSFRVHPGFRAKDVKRYGPQAPDDVAVLKLTGPLDLSGPAAQALALKQTRASSPPGSGSRLAGFGQQSETQMPTGALEEMHATVDRQGVCGFPKVSNQTVLVIFNGIERCARSRASAVCLGDSGAGLVTTGVHPQLIGVLAGTLIGNCIPGSHSIYTYVGAAEIRLFIQGNNHPPTAPRWSLELDASNPLHVGDSIACTSPGLAKATRVHYSFTTSSGRILQSGSRSIYVVEPAALGTEVICGAAATNAGGTMLEKLYTARVKPRRR